MEEKQRKRKTCHPLYPWTHNEREGGGHPDGERVKAVPARNNANSTGMPARATARHIVNKQMS